tara:strand:- start:49526 stop:50689 length:1164 start_codon:yes stop_codon:yes gene_type:complete
LSEKNWLIRTQQKQLLGPVAKDKIVEFIEKGSLTSEDEISSGNGYWFWIKEKDLVEKYVYGDMPQTFNPISEAIDVITAHSSAAGDTASYNRSPAQPPIAEKKEVVEEAKEAPSIDLGEDEVSGEEIELAEEELDAAQGDETLLPSNDDLEFPDMDNIKIDDIPEKIEVNVDFTPGESNAFIDEVNDQVIEDTEADAAVEAEGILPDASDLEFPSMPAGTEGELEAETETETETEVEFEIEVDEELEQKLDSPVEAQEDTELEENMTFETLQKNEEPSSEAREEFKDFSAPAQTVERVDLRAPEAISGEDKTAPKRKKRKKKRRRRVVHTPERNDRYLIYVAFLIIIIIGSVYFYYKKVLNKPVPLLGLINTVQAQTIDTMSKKKIL